MRFLSMFSGIEAASVAWHPLGLECVAVAEVDPFCCALLAEKYPTSPNLGDVQHVTREQINALGHIDVAVFGFPCQDLSVAGQRKGLMNDDGTPTRSGLFFDAMRIVEWANPRWVVAENVPGLFSSNGGRDFACVVGTLAGADVDIPDGGWRNIGVAAGPRGLVEWCVLDAQWFGVPQRRRRVFLVRDSGDWRSRPPVLFNADCLSGNPPPSREAGKTVAGTIAACPGTDRKHGHGWGQQDFEAGYIQPVAGTLGSNHGNIKAEHAWTGQLCYGGGNTQGPIAAAAVNAGGCKRLDFDSETLVAHSLRADGLHEQEINHDDTIRRSASAGTGREVFEGSSPRQVQAGSDECQGGSSSQTEALGQPTHCGARERPVAFQTRYARNGRGAPEEVCPTLSGADAGATSDMRPCVAANGVRRLVPEECEALQGFPRGYTAIEYRGKPAADGPRYKALGNSMAVPVMAWIGRRILEAEEL